MTSITTLNSSASVLDHALAYNQAGLSTIPIRTDGSKAPAITAWRPYAAKLPTEDDLRGWFTGSDRGIGLVHGAVSGGTEVIDLDDGALFDPYVEALDHLAPGLYQKLCVVQTPRPGYHLVYRCDEVEGNQKLALRPPNAEEIAEAEAEGRRAGPVTLIETRGEGGYTLAPGSPGACHSTGRQYVHFEGVTLDNLTRITAAERESLLMAARSLDRMPVEEPPAPTTKPDQRTYDGLSPGDDYNQQASWSDILEPHGWVRIGASGDRLLWRRPGKSDGWSATTGNVSKQGRELLCVFSSNAYPFDGPDGGRQCSTHSKFDCYARLHHDGDHSAAATELRRIGYGDRPKMRYADPAMRDLDPSAPPTPHKGRSANSASAEPRQAADSRGFANADALGHEENAPRWQPFPTDALPEVLRNFTTRGSSAIGCDPAYLAVPLLVVCASLIGASRVVQLKFGWKEPAIMWAAIVGESGTQKTPAFQLCLRWLWSNQSEAHRAYIKALDEYEREHKRYERDLAAWKKGKGVGGEPVPPVKPDEDRQVVTDTTIEALIRVLKANPRGVVSATDELAGWFSGFDKYRGGKAGGDVAAWLSMFNAGPIRVDRVNAAPVYIPGANVSVVGGIQPGILRRALSEEHRESGLAARVLLVCPPRRAKRWTESEMPEQTERRMHETFASLTMLQPASVDELEVDPVVVRLSPEAKALFVEFVNNHGIEAETLSGDLAAAWSKLEAYLARIALVLHCVRLADEDLGVDDDDDTIDEFTMRSALDIIEWLKHETRRVYATFNESAEKRQARELVEWIASRGGDLSLRDIQTGRRELRTAGDAEKAVADLVAAGDGETYFPEGDAKGGRPSQRFRLHQASALAKPHETAGSEGFADGESPKRRETAFDAWGAA